MAETTDRGARPEHHLAPAATAVDSVDSGEQETGSTRHWSNRLTQPILDLLRQGVTPRKLAWSLALGVVLGLFPMVGTTTLLCTVAALALRLNLVAMQTANYVVYPLQIALLLPFLRGGELLFGGEPLPLDVNGIRRLVDGEGWRVVLRLGDSGLYAVGAWALVSPFLLLTLVALLQPLLQRALRR